MAKAHPKQGKQAETLADWIKTLVVVLAVVITFRGVVAQAYQIPTGSMERTLLVGDYLYINKMLYGSEIDIGFKGHRYFYHRFPAFRHPQRGDIIVFRYPPNPRQDFIKRCVATGGQWVEIRNKVLYVDGQRQTEPFAIHDDPRVFPKEVTVRDNFGPFQVPPHHLFMMGDNRDNSLDSRFWGPLPENMVKGKAMFTYFSWDPGEHMVRFNRMFRGIS
ncbi:MAG TPA: signal peptidase I [Gemmatimonadales bacterium]